MTTVADTHNGRDPRALRPIPRFIFASRWLQLPLYLGLIVAQMVYVYLFLKELIHLVMESPGVTEQQVMLVVLGPDRRGDDLQPADHGDRRRLRDLRLAHGAEQPSRPAGMAEPRQRQRAQDQARHGHHRHLVDPPAADLHRGRQARQAQRGLTEAGIMWQSSSMACSSCRPSALRWSTGSHSRPARRPRAGITRASFRLFMFLSPASPPSLLRSFGGLGASMQLKPPKLHRSVGG